MIPAQRAGAGGSNDQVTREECRVAGEPGSGKAVKKIITALTLCVALFAFWFPVRAQQAKRMLRLGYLAAVTFSGERPRIDAFRQGLRALGYVEGQNIAIDYRFADGKLERLPEVAVELVRLKVDVLMAISTNGALAAKRATNTIPIIFIGVAGPVEAGLVESLARPGENITGLTNIASVLSGKRLEVLKETVPKLSRVAVLWDPQNPGSSLQWKESEIAARELSLQIFSMEVSSANKYESAFNEAMKARSAALAVTLNPLAVSNQNTVVELVEKNRLPAIYTREDFVSSGGLMSYGPTYAREGRDAARLVDKILKGAKPADLPVEQPTKFELIINLKAAKQIGLTIPPNVLARADRVIR
jgi:putative ABC transport system substrate-binding protein